MSQIKVLPENVISKIAAGEVIERPAAVLKELLENAVDAGASLVRVEIEKAGRAVIRVNDNGAGMSRQDLRLSVERHATSKIIAFEDLDTLATFGFRGEALYSIAAVSKLAISTCRKDDTVGSKIVLEGGRLMQESDAPPVPGTTVEVRDLFFNTPARAKFLKSDASERGHLLRVCEDCALANPHTAFNVSVDGAEVYSLQAVNPDNPQSLASRIREITGKQAAAGMLYASAPGISVFTSAPGNMVASRMLQFFFVNSRPVFSKTMQQALYRAYEEFRQNGKHPATIVYLALDPSDFDVNIHPQKRDVRFKSESDIYKKIYATVHEALVPARTPPQIAPESKASGFREERQETYFAGSAPKPAGIPEAVGNYTPAQELFAAPTPTSSGRSETGWKTVHYRFLGQAGRSYLVFDADGGLVILDQHAAQERVLFEKYLEEFSGGTIKAQRLMIPVEVELSASAAETLMRWKDWFDTAGFEVERFSPASVLLHAVPAIFNFTNDKISDFICAIAETLGDPGKCAEDLKRETVAMMACKKAVKAKDALSAKEADALIKELIACRDGLVCPHGRPTLIAMTPDELARRFQRPGGV